MKRPPSFAEWLVANKARHEREAEVADRIREQRQRYEDRKTREREEERQRIEQRLAVTPEQLERSAWLDGLGVEQRRSRGWRR